MSFAATALYVGLNALILVWLGANVSMRRRRNKVSLGDGGDEMMNRAIRGHANAAEFIPVALLIIAATEAIGAPWFVVHGLGAALTLARLSHGYAFLGRGRHLFRFYGAATTYLVYIVGGLGLIAHSLAG